MVVHHQLLNISVYGLVDSFGANSYGNVQEHDENNNTFGPINHNVVVSQSNHSGLGVQPDFNGFGLPLR